MKNAKEYEKKVRKLLAEAKKTPDPGQEEDPLRLLVRSVLEENADARNTDAAMEALEDVFVDLNELRVALPREVVECVGKDFPQARQKARTLSASMQAIYNQRNDIDLSYMEEMTKRDLRRHFEEIGLSPYAAASMVLRGFGGHGVPVDRDLRDALEMEGAIHPESDIPDVQGFLERIVSQKDALKAHAFFREFVKKHAKELEKKRKKELAAREAEEARKRAAEEKAAQDKADAKAAEKARKEAQSAKSPKATSEKKTQANRKAAKAATKVVKKVKKVKKAARKPAGKSTAKPARKTTKKATGKKTAKKSATKKSPKRSTKKTSGKAGSSSASRKSKKARKAKSSRKKK